MIDSIKWIRFGADKHTGYPKFWEAIIFYFFQLLDAVIGLATLGLVHTNFMNWSVFSLCNRWRPKHKGEGSCCEDKPLTRIDAINWFIYDAKHDEAEQMEGWCTKDKVHYLKTLGHTDEVIEEMIADYLKD